MSNKDQFDRHRELLTNLIFTNYIHSHVYEDAVNISNLKIINTIESELGLTFVPEKETEGNICFANSTELRDDYKTTFAPKDILDYIYVVLHSPSYRDKYKEFLKIDFPRVPYPKDQETFWRLVKLDGEIRKFHLLESAQIEEYITSYPIGGSNKITKKIAKKDWELFDEEKQLGRIWINDEQYFDNIPLKAWEFYIGGYQPAQKWLKDRKKRTLTYDDILHYQKIIVALFDTDRIMQEIETISIK
ncbi:type ISP restriction/modification enzyme [Maribacter sp. ACAM166]|uniref:type ISP restriction/modification enzyme n=1 Tax=Maribacter sp. ACAM166 TaxID=2508996 RepID=UPI0014859206|nr:type ISP restriction/modification enzyme [Maribacter sp. ACAM166]